MNKLEISFQIKDEIYKKYNNGYSIRKLEREYPYSFTFLQKLVQSYNWEKQIEENYPQKNNYNIIAICKQTNKKFYDYLNESGAITRHVFNLYPEESKKSKYKRKSIEYSTGKFWYHEFFVFDYELKKEEKKCFYCDWTTFDINNQSGAYEQHLKNIHKITIDQYLKENPDDKKYFKHFNVLEPENGVTCKICGKKMNLINYKHLKQHNITIDEYKLQYDDNLVSKETHEKLMVSGKKGNLFVKKNKTSINENLIKNFLEENNILIKQSKRNILNGLEIDLYSPEYQIGIEFNGNLYHTELYGKKEYRYHLNKTKIATEKKIKLIHIFEDEWENKTKIIKTKLLHLFNKNNGMKLHGRKLKIKTIENKTTNSFLDEFHIQGSSKSNIRLGAFHNNELVAVMCFDNKRNFNKEGDHNNNIYELTRFATHSDYIIRGIASKLLKHFIRNYNPEKIISFADRRWTPNQNNNLYTKLGFQLTKILKPDYSYYNRKTHRSGRLHKFGFGKSSLKKRHPEIYDDNKTEWEMMQELGYDRIWDCGKFKYELIL